MSLFLFKLTVEGLPRKRDLPKALKFMWARAGVLWHTRFMPQHFTARGAMKYGYGPRSTKYMLRKMTGYKVAGRTVAGHRDPLVWSGASKRLAAIQDVRATSKGGTVVIHATGLNRRNPDSISPKTMRQELLTVTDQELAIIAKNSTQDLTKALLRLGKRNRKTVRNR